MHIIVERPYKSDQLLAQRVIEYGEGGPVVRRLGFSSDNFSIPHLEVWDSFLPLMHITRNGGPLYNRGIDHADVEFGFPVPQQVADFFIRRAQSFGLSIEIHADTTPMVFERQTSGVAVFFGGGKDSRLLLGTLNEVGRRPRVVAAWGQRYAADIPYALTVEPHYFAMPNRLIPGLMLLPSIVYHGSALSEIHIERPWQQYYDISAWQPLRETSKMFASLGLDISIRAPQSIVPTNIVQKMLTERYPTLQRHQVSVNSQVGSTKNLHVSLAKRYHGIDHADHCSEELLGKLLRRFVRDQLSAGDDVFGYRACSEVSMREMRCIILRLHTRGHLPDVGLDIPEAWDASWIDYLHPYVNPTVEGELLALYGNHADDFDLDRAEELPTGLRAHLERSAT